MASAGVSEVFSQIADGVLAVPPTAFGALGALGLIGAALFVADPEKRWSFAMPLLQPTVYALSSASATAGMRHLVAHVLPWWRMLVTEVSSCLAGEALRRRALGEMRRRL